MRNGSFALLLFLAMVFLTFCDSPSEEPSTPPNVLLILTDDQGYGDVQIHGTDSIDTPVQNRLATEGIRMDNFYVSPVCAPTRASLLTGRYHYRTGTTWVTRNGEAMRAEEVTLAEVFKDNGYATGCFGKWHNGAHYPQNPQGQGFDEFTGFSAGHWNNYFNPPLESNGAYIQGKGYITDILTDSAISFIRRNEDNPFFCYVPYNTPHTPYIVPEELFVKYKQRGLTDKVASTYGMVESIDRNMGRMLDELQQRRLLDNTVVIFITDNGPNYKRQNGGMKGRKGWVNDGGVRVPCFIYWKDRLEGGRVLRDLTSHIDLLPTLVELMGLRQTQTLPLDGISFAGLLTGDASELPHRELYTFHVNLQQYRGAVRTQDYRLTINGEEDYTLTRLLEDPSESNDLRKENPEMARQLYQAYLNKYAEVTRNTDEFLPLPLGHDEAPKSHLQGHEAFLAGSVSYSTSEWGWANDWVKNWTSTQDTIYWVVDVAEDGIFDLSLQYACSPQNTGSTIVVQAGEHRAEYIIDRAFEPELIPSREKVARQVEAVERTWAMMPLGSLQLKKGLQRIVLFAKAIAGKEVAEVKALIAEKK